MIITFLGTASSFGIPQIACDCDVCTSNDPRDTRMRCCIRVEQDDQSVVVDTPPEFRLQCLRANIDHLDAVLYTHLHADHIFGADDLRRFNVVTKTDLPVYVPTTNVERFCTIFDYAVTNDRDAKLTRPKFDVRPVTHDPLRFGRLSVKPVDVDHGECMITGYVFEAPPSQGQAPSPRFAYLTDCKRLPDRTIEAIKEAEVVVISALWENWTHPNHMNLEEALELAECIGAEVTYLTHLTHFMGRHEVINAKLPPSVKLAYDGLKVELGDNRPAV